MRSVIKLAAVVAVAGTLAACGGNGATQEETDNNSQPQAGTTTKAETNEATPQQQWIAAVKAAGFEVKEGLTYENMYGRAKLFCDVESKAQLAQLARLALSSEEGASMTAPGKDSDVAAQRYADATWKYACNK